MTNAIECRLSWSEDLLASFVSESAKNSKLPKRIERIVFASSVILWLGAAFLAGFLDESTSVFSSSVTWCFIGIALCLLSDKLESHLRMRAAVKKLLSELTTSGVFDANGITAFADGNKSFFSWGNVQKILTSKNGFALYLNRSFAVPISDKDLPDAMSRDDAIARINEWRNA